MNLDNIELIEPISDGTIDNSPPEGVDPDLWKMWNDEEAVKKDKFLWQLKRGIQGHNIGHDNGMPNLSKHIHGTHKARYYLIGGESGCFKTTLTDFMFVFKSWESAKKRGTPIKIYYWSFEIGKIEKMFRWCSYIIYIKHGIQLPSSYLQAQQATLTDKKHINMILQAYAIVTEMMKDIVIIEDICHPTKIFEAMVEEHFAKHGTVERTKVPVEELKKNPNKKGYVKGYTENDPDLVTISIIDHLALVGHELSLGTKDLMDKMSKYNIVLRNLFYCTPVDIQQFSTDMMSTYRGTFGKKTEGSITPSRLDFGDSKATYRNADIVLGAVKPQNDMKMFHGYNLDPDEGLGDYFVAWYLMKHRYGAANRMIPLFVDPIVGIPFDLPLDNNDFSMQEWYQKAQQIDKICQTFSPKPGNQS